MNEAEARKNGAGEDYSGGEREAAVKHESDGGGPDLDEQATPAQGDKPVDWGVRRRTSERLRASRRERRKMPSVERILDASDRQTSSGAFARPKCGGRNG